MARRPKVPVTPAVRALRTADVSFQPHLYDYVPRGGAKASAAALGAPLHQVVKTLILEDDGGTPMIVLMHGGAEVSTKALARHLGTKTVRPCDPAVAQRHSGYKVGGTSPFGTRKPMAVYVQKTILELPRIWINGGRRGFLVSMDPRVLTRLLGAQPVDVVA